jgi:N-methylhydantoinase A
MGLMIGVDIGGTFTDTVAYDAARRQLYAVKVPSTPADPVVGFAEGVRRVLRQAGIAAPGVERIIHGTTVGTNTLLERKGSRLGILMTEGFEDTLIIGRQKRTDMYDLFIDPETPLFLCPRRRIRGVPERLDAEGRVLRALDEDRLLAQVRELVERHGVDSLAVCYLFSFLNPAHERRTRDLVARHYPRVRVSLSCELDPRFREYERLCVTAFDAYIGPIMERYLTRLEGQVRDLGVGGRLQVMHSRGGITGTAMVLRGAVRTVLSGPAAGVIGGQYLGERGGARDLITLDIGGTSCDVALVQAGRPLLSTEGQLEKYPIRLPMVDVHSIGAGGGSIARVVEGGALRVGPASAGATPGPACYGQGGREPTVTDASLVLGYLNPAFFAGGELKLDPDLAHRAIRERVAGPLGLDVTRAAWGIHRIVNSNMAGALHLISVKRGYDPRQFALMAGGGGGPVHAGRLAEALNIARVLVPATPGLLSAFGLLVARVEHEHATTFKAVSGQVDPGALTAAYADLERQVRARMAEEGVPLDRVETRRYAELRYVGQSYELEVPVSGGALGPGEVEAAAAAFHAVHDRVYGHQEPTCPVEFVTLRVVESFPLPAIDLGANGSVPAGDLAGASKGVRPAYFNPDDGYVATPVYDRSRLGPGSRLTGPAIIEQADTTSLVYPGHACRVDPQGMLVMEIPGGADRGGTDGP